MTGFPQWSVIESIISLSTLFFFSVVVMNVQLAYIASDCFSLLLRCCCVIAQTQRLVSAKSFVRFLSVFLG